MTDTNAQRLVWLHSSASNDVDGYEWGIFRVKWKNGQPVEVWQTASDFSDLDAARLTAPTIPQAAEVPGLPLAQEPKYTVNGSAIVNRASAEVIPADEPVFIFRARDKHAVEVLEFYRDLVRDSEHREAIDKRTGHFYVFRNANPWRMKEPDTAPTPTSSAPRAEGEDMTGWTPWRAEFEVYWNGMSVAPGTDARELYSMKNAALDAWRTCHEKMISALTQPPSEADRTREGGDVVASHPIPRDLAERLTTCLGFLPPGLTIATNSTTTSEGANHG